MSLREILKQELELRQFLSVEDVMEICSNRGNYFDSARRKMESDTIPNAKKTYYDNGNISGWVLTKTPKRKPAPPEFNRSPQTFNQDKELETLTQSPLI